MQKKFVLDLVDANVMISNKRLFYMNSVAILITIALFAILPYLYLTAGICTMIIILMNQRATKRKMGDLLKDVEWEIIFFFISLYIVIGCLEAAGFKDLFADIPFEALSPPVLNVIILLVVSLISGFVANTPTALIFIPIIQVLIAPFANGGFNFASTPLLFSFIIGINLGGNLIPQGAACDMVTLKIAQKSEVENFSFKRLLKVGGTFALIHIALSLLYVLFLTFI
jgi:Na+/H+ antiporter NhaD/arsenite permease-like protein